MSESTSLTSFYELLTRVSKKAGLAQYGVTGQGKAMPPIDAHDLDLMKEIVNKGIRQFIADAPSQGWRWTRRILSVPITGLRITGTADAAGATSITDLTLIDTYDSATDLIGYYIYILTGTGAGSYAIITTYNQLTGAIGVADWLDQYGNPGGTDPAASSTFAITPVETVGGDIARYPLPHTFCGSPDGKIDFIKDSNHGTYITWVDESFIRANRAVQVQTGYPRWAALRKLEPVVGTLGPSRRYELILDPQPSATETLEFPYTVTFDRLDAELGKATGGGATTVVDSTRTEGDDYFNGWRVRIVNGTGYGSNAIVTDYTGSSGTITVAAWLKADGSAGGTAPTANSIYYVEPLNNLHPAGSKFDQAVEASCLNLVEMDFPDSKSGDTEKYIQKELPQAYKLDMRDAPRTLGRPCNGFNNYRRERYWKNVELQS